MKTKNKANVIREFIVLSAPVTNFAPVSVLAVNSLQREISTLLLYTQTVIHS